LLVVAVIAFCWAHRVGEWQHEQVKLIKVKKINGLPKAFLESDWIVLVWHCLSQHSALRMRLSYCFHFWH
jgi:hypothetical protein